MGGCPLLRVAAAVTVLALFAAGGPAPPAAADALPAAHTLTLTLWGSGLIALVDESGTPVHVWVLPRSESVFDLELLPDRHLLVTLGGVGGLLQEGVGLGVDPGDALEGAVVELDATSRVVWSVSEVAGQTLSWTHDADYLPATDTFLIADTTSGPANADRVIEVDRAGNVVWAHYLPDASYPNDADRLPNGNTLISLRNHHTVIEVDPAGNVVWSLGGDDGIIRAQHNPDRLANGNTLVADSGLDRVVEVTPAGEVVWEFGGEGVLSWPRDADRLPNGNTLIVDTHNARIIEVTPAGDVVWELKPPGPGLVYDADRVNTPPVVDVREPRDGASVPSPVRFDVLVTDDSPTTATYRLFDATRGRYVDFFPRFVPEGAWERDLHAGRAYRLEVTARDAAGEGGGFPQDDSMRESASRHILFQVER